ncbi:hypothetical protein ACLB1R_01190 [Escherichia coli]
MSEEPNTQFNVNTTCRMRENISSGPPVNITSKIITIINAIVIIFNVENPHELKPYPLQPEKEVLLTQETE